MCLLVQFLPLSIMSYLAMEDFEPFDACSFCLKPFIDPLSCQKGHVFCKECILECLLAQKKDIQRSLIVFIFISCMLLIYRICFSVTSAVKFSYQQLFLHKLAAHAAQHELEKEEEEEKLMLQKARDLDAFDQQNHGAVPQYNYKNFNRDKNGFHGANSVKVTSYEEEALRTMKALWLPFATPEAPAKVEAPSTDTICPEGKEKLRMKTPFPIYFTEDTSEQKKSSSLDKSYICPSCKVTLTNTLSLIALSSCGQVFCKKCAEKFMAVDKVCLVCDKPCKERNLFKLEKGGILLFTLHFAKL